MPPLRQLGPTVSPMDMRTARPGPKVTDPFYLSSDWRTLLAKLIRERGRKCQKCGKTHEDDGSPVRLIGDHIMERRDGGADLDPANIELLCSRSGGNGAGKLGGCHSRKTAESAKARFRR